MAPISATLFVVEEAATHFSLALLWRTFSAAMVAVWASHWLTLPQLLGALPEPADDPDSPGAAAAGSPRGSGLAHFELKFDLGSGAGCALVDGMTAYVVLIALLGGLLGAATNSLILRVNAMRTRLVGPHATARRRRCLGAIELVLLALLTSSASVLLPELVACKPLTASQLEFGFGGEAPRPGKCAAAYGKCGGRHYEGPSCCPEDWTCHSYGPWYSQCLPTGVHTQLPLDKACMPLGMRAHIQWTNATAGTCDATCLSDPLPRSSLPMLVRSRCGDDEYNDAASLLLASSESTVRALFLRGAPWALGAPALLMALGVWLVLTVLTAGVMMPVGLMVPMIVIGGCMGRLVGLLARAHLGSYCEPSFLALIGSTALLAGSGQIRLCVHRRRPEPRRASPPVQLSLRPPAPARTACCAALARRTPEGASEDCSWLLHTGCPQIPYRRHA